MMVKMSFTNNTQNEGEDKDQQDTEHQEVKEEKKIQETEIESQNSEEVGVVCNNNYYRQVSLKKNHMSQKVICSKN
jgi:hypothetical protein